MPTATVRPSGVNTFFDFNGKPLAGGLVYTYATGTSTPLPTFSDAGELAANPNPIVLDAAGRATIFWDGIYKVVVRSADGSLSETIDPLGDANSIAAFQAALAGSGANQGGSLVAFLSSAASATPRTMQDREDDTVHIFDFMTRANKAHCVARDGLFDATAACQAAHNTGKLVDYGDGTFLVGPFTIQQGGIRGRGRGVTRFYTNDTSSSNIIGYVGSGAANQVPTFEDFHVDGGATKSGGAALGFAPGSAELSFAHISGISAYNFPTCVDLTSCSYGQMIGCVLTNYLDKGVLYANSVDPGSGDFLLMGNHLGTGQATGLRTGILQTSGGGLRVIGNKVLGGGTAFVLAYAGNVQSGPLIITGNSFENYLQNGIYLGATGGGFGGIVIGNNEMSGPNGIVTDASGRLSQLLIAPNYFTGVSGQGVSLTGVAGFLVAPQLIVGAGNVSLGIGIAPSCSNGKVQASTYVGCNTTLYPSSTTTNYELDEQDGVGVSVTTSTAFGSFYIGSTPIVFTQPFTIIPTVLTNGSSANGCVSVHAEAVTKTGFNMVALGIQNGGVCSGLSWTARGVV